jgi:hypothetical protein
MLRIRDFIETVEGLIFSSVSYHHPEDRYYAYLRYYPSPGGDRGRGNRKYAKISSTGDAEEYLRKNYPLYIGEKGQWVLKKRVAKIYRPEERLREILEKPRGGLEEKAKKLSAALSVIPASKKGVTGSLMLNLQVAQSDIDFVVYGIENHARARETIRKLFKEGIVDELNRTQWRKVYEKRFPGEKTIGFQEFLWHEKRKYHRGIIDGTIFDVLLVRELEELERMANRRFTLGQAVLRCKVLDASLAFDSPAVYKVRFEDGTQGELFSYTHTYAGQAFQGEIVEARGVLEVTEGGQLRLVVGTTREAEGEYIKVTRSAMTV